MKRTSLFALCLTLISNGAELLHPRRVLPERDGLGGGLGRRHRLGHILYGDRAWIRHPARLLHLAPIDRVHIVLILY